MVILILEHFLYIRATRLPFKSANCWYRSKLGFDNRKIRSNSHFCAIKFKSFIELPVLFFHVYDL